MCSGRTGRRCSACKAGSRCRKALEEIAPSFQHYGAESLPTVKDGGFTARVIAGSSFGAKSPVEMVSPWFYTEVALEQGMTVPLDPDHEERAIYVIDGEIEIAHERYQGPRLLIFRPGDRITVKANTNARMMFLGGDALEGPRHIWWNFVSSSKERIEQAKQDWKSGRFAPGAQRTRVHSAAGVTRTSAVIASHGRKAPPEAKQSSSSRAQTGLLRRKCSSQ